MRWFAGQYTYVPTALLESCLPASARMVAVAIASYASSTTGAAHPSVESIAARAGYDRRTAMRAIAKLEQTGWLTVTRRPVHGRRHRTTVYQLNDPTPHDDTIPITDRGAERPPLGGRDAPIGGQSAPQWGAERPPNKTNEQNNEQRAYARDADPEPLEGGSGPLTEPVERDGQLYFESTTEMLAWHRRMKDAG